MESRNLLSLLTSIMSGVEVIRAAAMASTGGTSARGLLQRLRSTTATGPPCYGGERLRPGDSARAPHRLTEGVQVAIVGAETAAARFLALLLKQSPCCHKLCLYDGRPAGAPCPPAPAWCALQDLRLVNTRCRLEAYGAALGPDQLDRCLQNCDIVVLMEHPDGPPDLSSVARESRYEAVARCAAAAVRQCPRAALLVDMSPAEGCVPVAAAVLAAGGGHPRRALGVVALAESRARAAAARALRLPCSCVRVPCVGGADSDTSVPLFSNALDYFSFSEHDAERLAECARRASGPVSLSRAHALAGLVAAAARSMLRGDGAPFSAFVRNDCGQLLVRTAYVARPVRLGADGVARDAAWPRMAEAERRQLAAALGAVEVRVRMAEQWLARQRERAAAAEARAEEEVVAEARAPCEQVRGRIESCSPCVTWSPPLLPARARVC